MSATPIRGMKSLRTLVLNADYSPISFTSLRRAIAMVSTKRATALELADQTVRSESLEFERPSVVVLSHYRRISSRKASTPTRSHVLSRDMFTCRYCGAPGTSLDHVHPRSRGGQNTWDNLVASCESCNQRKGSKLLRECELKLRAQPRPRSSHNASVTRAILSHARTGVIRSLQLGRDTAGRGGNVKGGQREWVDLLEGSSDLQAWMKWLTK
jgi:5-methylcytosine-specific restriction endonuclease McrA